MQVTTQQFLLWKYYSLCCNLFIQNCMCGLSVWQRVTSSVTDGHSSVSLLMLMASLLLNLCFIYSSEGQNKCDNHADSHLKMLNACKTRYLGTYTLFFLLFRRAVGRVAVVAVATSWERSGRALASGLMSPTMGVACLLASAACCSLACLMEQISERKRIMNREAEGVLQEGKRE